MGDIVWAALILAGGGIVVAIIVVASIGLLMRRRSSTPAPAPPPPSTEDESLPATIPPFMGFTPWAETQGVIRGASRSRVKLKRQPSTSDYDWTLLRELWFYLIEAGTKTQTFGYKKAELLDRYDAPLARWVQAAKTTAGSGAETLATPNGDVVRINVAADTITEL